MSLERVDRVCGGSGHSPRPHCARGSVARAFHGATKGSGRPPESSTNGRLGRSEQRDCPGGYRGLKTCGASIKAAMVIAAGSVSKEADGGAGHD